jgi:hypothetical protein
MSTQLNQWIAYLASLPGPGAADVDQNVLSDLAMWVIETPLPDEDRNSLVDSLAKAIGASSSATQRTSLLFILRKADAVEATRIAKELLEPVVRQMHDLGSLLYHVVDYATSDLELTLGERNTGPMDVQENLRIAESVLGKRGVFVPW